MSFIEQQLPNRARQGHRYFLEVILLPVWRVEYEVFVSDFLIF